MAFDKWATDKMCEWLNNDYDYYQQALQIAAIGPEALQRAATSWLNRARGKNSAAGWTRKHLSDSDLEDGVHWAEVCADILSK